MILKIQANPYVIKEETNNEKLSNTLTGEKILCGEKIIELVDFLKIPRDFQSIEEKFVDIKGDLPQLINTLLAKKFVFQENKIEEVVTTITPCNPHLYNLPYLSKRVKSQLENQSIVFVGIPLGIGNKSNSNCSNYPNSFRNYISKYGLKLDEKSNLNFSAFGIESELSNLKLLKEKGRLFDLGNIFFDINESPSFCYAKIETIAADLFSETEKQIPVFIGGDHSISYPIIKSAIEKFGDDLCVIHFDAHTDTYDSPYSKIEHKHKLHHHGNFMTKCFEAGLKHAYQFGIRGVVNNSQVSNKFQTIYWCGDLKKMIYEQFNFDELPKDKKYYITFDFDVLDPNVFAGTSTPVVNGLTLEECTKLIKLLLHDKDIVGVDLVELYTNIGELNITHQIANHIIFNLLNVIK